MKRGDVNANRVMVSKPIENKTFKDLAEFKMTSNFKMQIPGDDSMQFKTNVDIIFHQRYNG